MRAMSHPSHLSQVGFHVTVLHHESVESVLWIWQFSVFPETRQAQWMDLDLRKVHGGGRNLLSTAGPFCSKTEKCKTLRKAMFKS